MRFQTQEGGAMGLLDKLLNTTASQTGQSAPAVSGWIRDDQMAHRDRTYFASILSRDFADYEIREMVPAAELGAVGRPYDFGMYKAGLLRAVVMLVEHNRDNNRAYLGPKEAARLAGIPFINFYLHMPNEYDFVVSRIRRMALTEQWFDRTTHVGDDFLMDRTQGVAEERQPW